ncbi:MAG TPA: XRE family transcriptional regulator [Longimicrobium sp.]|nr:XRE family transcriptional regulator [Longimicrobium sp.]
MARNDLEQLKERLEARFPDASLTMDRPESETGTWWLDARVQGHLVVIQWRPDRGYGISTPTRDDYGSKPHELYDCADAAYKRAVDLLLSQTRTVPGLSLQKIRESRGLSQVAVAQKLQINQGALSRLERRTDMRLRTLRNLISAMGGELQLFAEFPNHTVRIQIDQLLSGD